jgi:hypothetical protein
MSDNKAKPDTVVYDAGASLEPVYSLQLGSGRIEDSVKYLLKLTRQATDDAKKIIMGKHLQELLTWYVRRQKGQRDFSGVSLKNVFANRVTTEAARTSSDGTRIEDSYITTSMVIMAELVLYCTNNETLQKVVVHMGTNIQPNEKQVAHERANEGSVNSVTASNRAWLEGDRPKLIEISKMLALFNL